METFSVPLDAWLKLLMKPTEEEKVNKPDTSVPLTVNFIQVCRNYFRLPPAMLGTNQAFLKQLYNSGCAVYLYDQCSAFDILAPVKLKLRKCCEYIPLFIQFKTYAEFTPHDETAAKSKMENAIKSSQIKRGLCLLLVAGQLDHVKSTRESTIPNEKKKMLLRRSYTNYLDPN